jgi:AraC-like DNA-binding protein
LSSRQHNEYSMALVLKTFRTIAGNGWRPRAIQFVHEAPSRTSEHVRVFGRRASFGCAVNACVVDRDFFERRVPAADPRLYRILQCHAERILGEMPRQDDLLVSVRRAIVEAMREGRPTLTRAAGKLALSARTLQRRLKAHGAVFEELADDTRRRFALDYLEHRKHTLTEIAFLLGYSEASAFNRAFRRWTASTPLAYRRKTALHRTQQAR